MEKVTQKYIIRFYWGMVVMLIAEIINCSLVAIEDNSALAYVLGVFSFMNLALMFSCIWHNYKGLYFQGEILLNILRFTIPVMFIPVLLSTHYFHFTWFRTLQDIFELLMIVGVIMYRSEIIGGIYVDKKRGKE